MSEKPGGSKAKADDEYGAGILGVGSGGTIYFNYKDSIVVDTVDYAAGDPLYEYVPKEIELGHELIHVLRYMGGYRKNVAVERAKDGVANIEEYETTGLDYYLDGKLVRASTWKTTENALRRENGYNERSYYFSSYDNLDKSKERYCERFRELFKKRKAKGTNK